MNKSIEYDRNNMLSDLVHELSELNRKMEEKGMGRRFASEQWNFLFGFDPENSKTREEYRRYVMFMKSITGILREFGIHPKNNGYTYIIDSVLIIIDRSTLDIRLSGDVYPYVAIKYGLANPSAVEHNIRNAIKSSYRDNEKEPGINRMSVFRKRPTNKEFLFYITEMVCSRMCETLFPQAS